MRAGKVTLQTGKQITHPKLQNQPVAGKNKKIGKTNALSIQSLFVLLDLIQKEIV